MQHFYVWKFNRLKRWILVVVAALFCAVFLWVESGSSLSVFSTDNGPKALVKSGNSKTDIALTFNISWGQEKVYEILDTLKKENVKVTFFVSGEWAERHPDIVKRIKEDKHELGMMGYRYKSYVKQDITQVRKDLAYAREVFRKMGYTQIKLLRPPSGHFNNDILKLADKMGYSVIHWNINPDDWRNPGTQVIINTVMEQTSGGDIILLQASDSVKQTNNALKTILPGLKKKGYNFVTVSELISKAKTKTEQIN